MKKSLFVLPTPTLGGAEKVTRIVAEHAAKNRLFDLIEIVFLCGIKSDNTDELQKLENVNLVFLGAKRELFSVWKFILVIIGKRYDVAFSTHTHINALLSLLRYLKVLRSKKLITRESTLIFDRNFGLRTKIIQSFYKLYGAQDIIICQTGRMAHSLKVNTPQKLHNRIIEIPNPIEKPAAPIASPTSPDRSGNISLSIVWCGRLVPIKNPQLAIATIAKLREKSLIASLTVLGDGPLRSKLETLAWELGVADQVYFEGFVKNPKDWFNQADLGLITSDLEGFPNVIIEMLATNIVSIVSTNCAGGLERLPDVRVTQLNDPESLSQNIIEVWNAKDRPDYQARVEMFDDRSPANFWRKCGVV